MRGLAKESIIAGVDEAGRGPLAGPVVAAAVILNPKRRIRGLADSKQLSAVQREKLFLKIREHAIAWFAARATVAEIDQLNILQATLLAMQRAVQGLKVQPQLVLVDGNQCPLFACPAQPIIRGDESEPAISAASIVAKVLRDRMMVMLARKYPDYGFDQHKGYSTAMHLDALRRHGASRIHRRSFAPVAKALLIEA